MSDSPTPAPTTTASRSAVSFILVTSFLNLAGIGLIGPVLPPTVARYVPAEQVDFFVAVLLGAYSFFQFLFVPLLGALSDRYGRRPVLLFSLLGSALGYVLLGVGGALWVLFAGRIIDGITGGNLAAIYAYGADITTPRDRTRFFGLLGAAAGFGFVIGPALGGLIYRLAGQEPRAPFYTAAILTLINTIWGYFAMPENLPAEKRSDKIAPARLNPFRQLADAFALKHLRLLFVVIFLWTLAFSILQANLGSFAQTRLGQTVDTVSLVFFLIGSLSIVVQGVLIRRLLPLYGEATLMRFGLASQAVGFAILVVMALTLQAWLVFVAVVFTAVGNALVIPTSTSLSSQSVGPLEQGRAQGGNQAVQALGRVVGPAWVSLVLGLSAAAYVVPYLTMLMAALLALGVLGLALPALRTTRETTQPMRS